MMRRFSLAEAAVFAGGAYRGEGRGEDLQFNQVSTDTRTLQPGDLFVALRGPRFDGHQFIAQAAAAGAVAAIVDTQLESSLPQILVPDTTRALGLLARANRRESPARVIAVTGSSGKTTVKEMLRAILAEQGHTLATRGNLNNAIGVPLTLFRLSPTDAFAVIELGASGVGEIAWTVSLAEPDVAVITNAGQAHLEGFGSYENVILGKGEIIEGVPEGGTVVLNRDDPAFDQWHRRSGSRNVISAGLGRDSGADFWLDGLESSASGQRFVMHFPGGGTLPVSLPLLGRHNAFNALLATAGAMSLGATEENVRRGLEAVSPVSGRLQLIEPGPGVAILDDSYNANPGSMGAALQVLADRDGRRVAILGDMAELGEDAVQIHRRTGEQARALGIDELWVRGRFSDAYAEGFGPETVQFDELESLDDLLCGPRPLSILVKGSRSAAMDRVVARLKDKVTS